MSRNLELKKDQKVIIRYINDRIRYTEDRTIENIDKWTTESTITKVGRKYIEATINGFPEKFDIEYDYVQKVRCGSPDYKIYLSKEEIIEEVKCEELYSDIKNNYFGGYGRNNGKFTLDQLERIMSIINE